MRNWSNPVYDGTLEQAVAASPQQPYVERTGLEVVDKTGNLHVLAIDYNSIGHLPLIGEEIQCSALGVTGTYRVQRYAVGYPGRIRIFDKDPDYIP